MSTKNKNPRPVCAAIGIDVAADKIDLCAVEPSEKPFLQLACKKENYAKLVKRIVKLAPAVVVLEATGGYEKDLLARLWLADVPVRVVKPANVRYFAKAIDQLAKTDAIDAHVLAVYALRNQVRPQAAPTVSQLAVRELCDRRQQLTAISVQEQNREKMATNAVAKKSIARMLVIVKKEIAEIDAQLDAHIAADETLARKEEILTGIPGVGKNTARVLLATVPELGALERNAAAKIVGLAPFARQSGNWRGAARIGGGRPAPRSALFLAAMSAIRCNQRLKMFYQRLLLAGKKRMVALTACMRKILLLANALLKKNQPFSLDG